MLSLLLFTAIKSRYSKNIGKKPRISKLFTTFWRTKHLTNYSVSPKVELSLLYHTLRWYLRQLSWKNDNINSLFDVYIYLAKQTAKLLEQFDFLGEEENRL